MDEALASAFLSMIERGEFAALADALDVPLAALFREAQNPADATADPAWRPLE